MKVIPGGTKPKSLLEQALSVPVARGRQPAAPTPGQLELAIAWYEGRVSTKQVAITLELMEQKVPARLQSWLKTALQLGHIEFHVAPDVAMEPQRDK